ncbi:MAG: chemotaxis protein CheW [Thermodesulfovibrionales bacterium]|nr:chemotaxis protein CheW [Thermodesulfovibrionales bacterium]
MVKAMEKEAGEEREITYCVFRVGEKDFLLPASVVREVVDIAKIFSIPGAPEYVYGVIPVRGKIVPAIDLSKIYPIDKPFYNDSKLIIVDVENENIGFLSESAPFFLSFDADIIVEDVIDIRTFFETYRIKQPKQES